MFQVCVSTLAEKPKPHMKTTWSNTTASAQCKQVDYSEKCLGMWLQRRLYKRTEPYLLFDMVKVRNRLALRLEMHQSGVM